MSDRELIALVRDIKSSLIYCAPEAIDELLFDKLHPYVVGPSKRIAELESELQAIADWQMLVSPDEVKP